MSHFENIVKIETKRSNIIVKAIYIPSNTIGKRWAYYLYYYDWLKNTFYINGIDTFWKKYCTSAINAIEHIVDKAYKVELDSLLDIMKEIQLKSLPKVKFIYQQKHTKFIILDDITLSPIKDRSWVIRGFKNPKWNGTWKKYVNEDIVLCS